MKFELLEDIPAGGENEDPHVALQDPLKTVELMISSRSFIPDALQEEVAKVSSDSANRARGLFWGFIHAVCVVLSLFNYTILCRFLPTSLFFLWGEEQKSN